MPAGENIDSNNGFGEQNPWQKMASEMPPFGEHNKAEMTSDEDSEYIDIDKIDISTDEGKSEWLDSLISNAIAKAQEDLSQATLLDDEEQITDAADRLRHAENRQKILNNLFDNTSDGSILDRLGENYEKHRQFAADLPIEATDEAKQIADERLHAASDLLGILESEMAHRDPNYFREAEMQAMLTAQVDQTEKAVEDSMVTIDTSSDIDDGMVMEEMPAGKTPEQIEAEKAARKRKEDAEFKRRMQEYMEQRDAEQKQREQNERVTREREQKEAERRERVKAAQEKVRQVYQQQEQENEQAEMEM